MLKKEKDYLIIEILIIDLRYAIAKGVLTYAACYQPLAITAIYIIVSYWRHMAK